LSRKILQKLSPPQLVPLSQDNVPKRTDFVLEVVRKLTGMIEGHLEVEGIYRKSGSNTKIDRIMKQLEKQNVNDADLAKSDIHDLCCVLKKFLSSLKDPLLPEDFYSREYSIFVNQHEHHFKNKLRKKKEAITTRDATSDRIQFQISQIN
jgi:hypothetical protein